MSDTYPLFVSRPKTTARRGAMTVLIAVMLMVVVAFVALLVDVNWMSLGRTELQAAVDQSARAALLHYATNTTFEDDEQRQFEANSQALSTFSANTVGGQTRNLPSQNIEFGRSFLLQNGTRHFSRSAQPFNSVRSAVDLTTDSSPISLFFAPLFGLADFKPRTEAIVAIRRADVVVALDVSRSMLFVTGGHAEFPAGGGYRLPPVPGARWFPMLDKSRDFLSNLAANNGMARVGLVTFGGGLDSDVDPVFPNTPSRREIELADVSVSYRINQHMDGYSSGVLGLGTSLSDAIYDSVAMLEAGNDPDAQRVVILLTDGEQWFRDRLEELDPPDVAAQFANDRGVVIHGVYFSGPPGEGDDLHAITDITGGEFFNAQNEADLEDAFEEISKLLPVRLVD